MSWPTRWLRRKPRSARLAGRSRRTAQVQVAPWTPPVRFVPSQGAPADDSSTVELFFRDGTRVRLPAAEAETFRRIADTLAGS